jgi:hypothetical protein
MTAAATDAAIAIAPEHRDRIFSRVAAGLALGFQLLGALLVALLSPFPTSLDEGQHLSFIRWLEARPALFPPYEEMRVLAGDGRTFTGVENYLNHPSPYYWLMGAVDRLSGGSVLALRLADAALATAGIGLMLAAGFRVLKGWRERALFAALLVLFPKLGVVAGMINNDNAALVATGAAFLGLVLWHQRDGRREALFLAAALALAGWTKLTVLLMLGFGVALAELLRPGLLARLRAAPVNWLILAAGGLLGSIPTLVNFARYGRALYHSHFYFVPVAERADVGFFDYAGLFFWQLAVKWPAMEPGGVTGAIGLVLVLALAGLACATLERDAAGRVAVGLMLSLVPTLLLHLQFGWESVREDGFLHMAQTRYYYGVWPGFALGLALLWRAWRPGLARRAATAGVLIALLVTSTPFMVAATVAA